MKLSIIIPLYNSEKYITQCLDSLFKQDVLESAYEIIIINDGSKDNSLQLVEEYAANHTNIHIYSQQNKGVAAARNTGVKKAIGEFIFFIDSDDYIASNTLNTIINSLNNPIDLLTFKSVQTTRTDLEVSKNESTDKVSIEIIEGIDFIERYGFKDAIGWQIIRKKFLLDKNLSYLEGKMLEDISFNIKLLTTVKRVLYIPLDVYRYVSRENSIMTKKNAAHFKKIISDYERVLLELEEQYHKYKQNRKAVSDRLCGKRSTYHFFLFMRLMRSNMSVKELNKYINRYKEIGLHPLRYYNNRIKVKALIFIFNRKILFFPFVKIYRLFSKRAI